MLERRQITLAQLRRVLRNVPAGTWVVINTGTHEVLGIGGDSAQALSDAAEKHPGMSLHDVVVLRNSLPPRRRAATA